jgi:hypothetical protein
MAPALIIAAFYGVSIAALVRLIVSAPEGWEDRDGFHLGREPDEDLGRRLANRDGSLAPFVSFHSLRSSK